MTSWAPELRVDEALVRSLLGDRVDVDTLEYLASGWDHDVWASAHHVFRFPHQHATATLAADAADRLEALARVLPVPVPRPAWIGEPTASYPARYVAYDRLPGTLPAALPLTPTDRIQAAAPLAHLLRTLHEQPVPTNLPQRPSDLDVRTTNAQRRAEQLADTPFANLARRAADRMRWPPPPATTHTLIHGDLHPGQLLFDRQHRLSGVIDWDELCVGDPALDLAMVFSFLPPVGRERFFAIYGPTHGLDRARHVALSFGLAFLAQALKGDRPALLQETCFGLENALTD